MQSQAFFLVHLSSNVNFLGLFGPQNALNHRSVKHGKRYFSKKSENCGSKRPRRHIIHCAKTCSVSHCSAIGDIVSCDAPYSAIGFRGKPFLRYPPCSVCLWTAIGHFAERSGGVAAIVCDTTGNTVRQGYCYTCLAIGGYFGRVIQKTTL